MFLILPSSIPSRVGLIQPPFLIQDCRSLPRYEDAQEPISRYPWYLPTGSSIFVVHTSLPSRSVSWESLLVNWVAGRLKELCLVYAFNAQISCLVCYLAVCCFGMWSTCLSACFAVLTSVLIRQFHYRFPLFRSPFGGFGMSSIERPATGILPKTSSLRPVLHFFPFPRP